MNINIRYISDKNINMRIKPLYEKKAKSYITHKL